MRVIFILTFIFTLSSCIKKEGDKSMLPTSSGKYGEVLVVLDTALERGALSEAINSIFNKALDGMPQKEAAFRMSTVDNKAFLSILKRSRNVLKLIVDSKHKTKIQLIEDVWAKDQFVIRIFAPNQEKATSLLQKNEQTIRDYFNEKEKERLGKQFKKSLQLDLMDTVKQRLGVKLNIPPAFITMSKRKNGIWFKKEKKIKDHQIVQGLMIYTHPYNSDSTFSVEQMVNFRDDFTKENVQGTLENSYTKVYEEYKAVSKEINLNGVYAMEYRGLWNAKNDFMGGPFLHYTLVDEKNNRVINIDGFVYAPKFNKREYLRELEAICFSLKFEK